MSELDQYDYDLPKELIAQSPAACRSDARLLVVDRQRKSLEHRHIRDLPEILRRNDCLVDQRHAGRARPAGGPAAQHGRPLGGALSGGQSRTACGGFSAKPAENSSRAIRSRC